MEFNNLNELKDKFMSGKFSFPDEFKISGIRYTQRSSSNHSMEDMLKKKYKGAIVYSTPSSNVKSDELNHIGLRQWILFLWSFNPKSLMVPYDVRTMNVARGNSPITENNRSGNDNFIGSTVEVRITNIPGSAPMKGKVDTGADICSLHAEKWSIDRDVVRFACSELSQNTLTAQLVNHQSVKSADGGVEYRPVIELNIKVNGKLLSGVLFNLNDRGQMQFPILIGRNALQAGKFKIDPSLDEGKETIDWNYIQEQLENSEGFNVEYFSLTDIISQLQGK